MYAMQPLLSRMTSLISPISSPWALFTLLPMILLACTVVVLEVVVWVCAINGAVAKPRKAKAAPNRRDVFICCF